MSSADSSVLMPAPRPLQPPGVPGMSRGYPHPLHVASVAATGTSSGSSAGGRICAPPVGFGSPRLRSSYHDRLHPRRRDRLTLHQQQQRYHVPPSRVVDVIANRHAVPPTAGVLYRSSSSLELEHHHLQHDPARVGAMSEAALRREFGSHGSIDVMSRGGVFAQLKDFRSLDPEAMEGGGGRRSAGADSDPGRAAPAVSSSAVDAAGSESSSPRLRGAGGGASRLQRLWDRDRRVSRKNNSASAAVSSSTSTGGGASASEPSLFRRLRGSSRDVRGAEESAGSADSLLDADARQEERRRRRALVHYDWQSLLVNLGAAARRRGQLTQRRNTTTGASAASMPTAAAEDLQPTLPPAEEDQGDGRGNELVHSCPFFRNELGGEQERCISLSAAELSSCAAGGRQLHRPASTCGLSVLEQPPNLTHWPVHHCPFSRPPAPVLETSSLGAFYYKDFFHGKPHENWVGVEESLGPVAVSIRRDQLVSAEEDGPAASQTCYRVIVRSSELATIRGLVLEDSLCQLGKSSDKQKRLPVREVLDHVAPEIHPSCLRLAIPEKRTEDYLMKLDEQNVFTRYKVGVMYCRAGQGSEEEMYNNEVAGPAFNEFLEMIGQRVRLKGFDKYKAGLDNKTDTTGQYSVYAQYQGNEIMFHVSTMLQYSPNNRQQLLRKRYIGNDIVTIVFQEPGALPFSPKSIRSQFQHVFVVVRALNPCAGANTQYRVAVNRFRDVPPFGPPLSETAVYVKGKALAEFLYAKVINAETSSYQSEKFVTMARRTRQEYLKDLAANYVTDTTLDQHQKFSLMSFSSRKKERPRPRFNPDLSQRGAVAWPVTVDDHSRSRQFDCVLGISADAVVLADESSSELVFATPASSVLGWTLQGTSLRVYYHLGECVVLHARTSMDTEELAEIAARLAVVSKGTETQELLLRRNVMGQLGLHVQQDGLVTEVEQYSPAWQLGLRPGARLVEICKITVCSMTYDQMVDLLKTSPLVSVTLVAPLDGASSTALRGCTMPACGRAGGFERGDYENVQPAGFAAGEAGAGTVTVACRQEPPPPRSHQLQGVRRQRRRSTSPSLSSSGYNTAGTSGDGSLSPAEATGTMSSTSSAGSCGSATGGGGGGGRHGLLLAQESPPPPPLPVRHSRQQQVNAVRVVGGALVVEHPTAPVAPPSGQISNYMSPSSIHRNARQQQALRDSAYNYSELSSLVTRAAPPEQCNLNSLSTYLIDADSASTAAVPSSSSGPAAPPSLDSTGSSTTSSLKDQSRLLSERWSSSVEHAGSRSQQKAPDVRLLNGDASSSTSASATAASSSAAVAVRRSSATRTGGSHAAHRVSSSLQQDLLRLIAPGDDGAGGSRPSQEVIVTTARPATVVTPGGGDPRSAGLLQMDWQSLVDMADRASTAQHPHHQQPSTSTAAGDLNEHSRSSAGSACSAGRSSSLHSSPTSSLANGYPQQLQRSTSASTTSHDQQNGSPDNLLVGGGTASSSPENPGKIGRQDSPSSRTRSSPAMTGGSAEAPVEGSAVVGGRLVSIEQQLVREQYKRQTLENQVRQLSKDNRRLQEESKQAAQQLRKFTEWFFANFEKP